jgi:hypothetical protein
MRPTALYYPYFVPKNNEWLASALLWWEKLYLIWPEDIDASDPVIKEMIMANAVGRVDPTMTAIQFAPEFVDTVLRPNFDLFSHQPPSFSQSIPLHNAKVHYLVEDLKSVINRIGERYKVISSDYVLLDKAIEIPFMNFLADKLASNADSSNYYEASDPVTDDVEYLKHFGNIRNIIVKENTIKNSNKNEINIEDQANLIVFEDIALELKNITPKMVDELMDFRNQTQDSRKMYRKAVAKLFAATKQASNGLEKNRKDEILEAKKELLEELEKIEKQIHGTQIRAKYCDLAAFMGGIISLPGGPGIAAGVAAVGIIANEAAAANQVNEIIDQSPYSYLYKVKKEFYKRTSWGRFRKWLREPG